MKVNMNDDVFVKLKEKGFELLCNQYNEMDKLYFSGNNQKTVEYYKSLRNSQGFYRFQLWEFMQTFGSTMTMGFNEYFENDIHINKIEDK